MARPGPVNPIILLLITDAVITVDYGRGDGHPV